jgi:nicotinamidase-related amidase
MAIINVQGHNVNPALIVIDVQNGFVSKGGSYDELRMDISHYQRVIPNISKLIRLCRGVDIPIFYTQAVREKSGIDLLTNTHRILPKSREERIRKKPICVMAHGMPTSSMKSSRLQWITSSSRDEIRLFKTLKLEFGWKVLESIL